MTQEPVPITLIISTTPRIQLDLLLKVGQVLKTPVKTPILNQKVLIMGDLLLKTGQVIKSLVRNPMLNLTVLNMGDLLLKVGQLLKTLVMNPMSNLKVFLAVSNHSRRYPQKAMLRAYGFNVPPKICGMGHNVYVLYAGA